MKNSNSSFLPLAIVKKNKDNEFDYYERRVLQDKRVSLPALPGIRSSLNNDLICDDEKRTVQITNTGLKKTEVHKLTNS